MHRQVRRCAKQLALRQQLQRGCRSLSRTVDQSNVRTHFCLQRRCKQWVVRAAENECVDVREAQRREVLVRDEPRRGVINPTLLDQRHEQRTGDGTHFD